MQPPLVFFIGLADAKAFILKTHLSFVAVIEQIVVFISLKSTTVLTVPLSTFRTI